MGLGAPWGRGEFPDLHWRETPEAPCPRGSPIPVSLQKESQKADEYLREIREQQLLPEAVGQCIEAAGYEHEPETQKSLLRVSQQHQEEEEEGG